MVNEDWEFGYCDNVPRAKRIKDSMRQAGALRFGNVLGAEVEGWHMGALNGVPWMQWHATHDLWCCLEPPEATGVCVYAYSDQSELVSVAG
eukprot:scaffold87108_cov21-Tisochrysis_lutea.AAC.6